MTTAASVGLGRFLSSPGTSTSISTISAAPTTPVSWVLAPACSATAVRDPLVLTGNPWNKPAATLATPIPIISPLPSISCPVRAANAEAVEIVSVERDQRDAERAGDQQRQIGHRVRDGERREALWEACPPATRRGWPESNTDAAAIATTTATSTPGTRGSQRPRTRISARLTSPIATAAPDRLAEASPWTNARASLIRPLASVENPNSLGSCPIRIVSASPFM